MKIPVLHLEIKIWIQMSGLVVERQKTKLFDKAKGRKAVCLPHLHVLAIECERLRARVRLCACNKWRSIFFISNLKKKKKKWNLIYDKYFMNANVKFTDQRRNYRAVSVSICLHLLSFGHLLSIVYLTLQMRVALFSSYYDAEMGKNSKLKGGGEGGWIDDHLGEEEKKLVENKNNHI